MRYILKTPDCLYDPSVARNLLESICAEDQNIIISSESFTGCDFLGADLDAKIATCKRLHGLIPDARILLNIRRQSEWIESYYKNFVRAGYCMAFEDYLNTIQKNYMYEGLSYFDTYKTYAEHFSDVFVLPIETLPSIRAGLSSIHPPPPKGI